LAVILKKLSKQFREGRIYPDIPPGYATGERTPKKERLRRAVSISVHFKNKRR
jgi:hypothetical protein